MTLNQIFSYYYIARGLKMPTVEDALSFVQTELGEVHEVILAGKGYVRNNPECKRTEFCSVAFAEELGDAMMMLQMAGKVSGVDPLQALLNKLSKKTGTKYYLELEAE